MKALLASLLMFLPVNHSSAVVSACDEVLAALQSCMENDGSVTPLIKSLPRLPSAEKKKLIVEIEKIWPKIRGLYISGLEAAAKKNSTGAEKNKKQARVRELREQFQEVYKLDDGSMKSQLHSKSMPAVDELRRLLMPDAETMIKSGGVQVAKLRSGAVALGTFRNALLKDDLSFIEADSLTTLAAAEKKIAEDHADIDRNGKKILANNAKIAEKNNIPAAEVKGIEECNLWRLLVGLNACAIDPKLCAAARDHSKDMATKGFFAHESPVPGKKSPWDRAAKFDTSASGENIFMGSQDPHGANTGWFFSPGHHKNMFSAEQQRIGLGQHGNHWTQMFGR
ncbi:MAG: CAP domain-containing protein [Verrucomicrobia bacterium]|nr:CAP domain-containing protein [Verrucomicrobiota bacterium]